MLNRIREIEAHQLNEAQDSSRKMITNVKRPISNVEDIGFMTEHQMAMAYKEKLEENKNLQQHETGEIIDFHKKF